MGEGLGLMKEGASVWVYIGEDGEILSVLNRERADNLLGEVVKLSRDLIQK